MIEEDENNDCVVDKDEFRASLLAGGFSELDIDELDVIEYGRVSE
jgi:hypothetical protein